MSVKLATVVVNRSALTQLDHLSAAYVIQASVYRLVVSTALVR